MTDTNTEGKREVRKASTIEIAAIIDMMRKVAKTEDGICHYQDGYDDAKVAMLCTAAGAPTPLSEASVAHIRRELGFGALKRKPPPAKLPIEDRVEALERKMAHLLQELGYKDT